MVSQSKRPGLRSAKKAIEPIEVSESDPLPATENIVYPEGVKLGFIIAALIFSIIIVGLVSVSVVRYKKRPELINRIIPLLRQLFPASQMILRPSLILAGILQPSKCLTLM
jgi:hypothetical protein